MFYLFLGFWNANPCNYYCFLFYFNTSTLYKDMLLVGFRGIKWYGSLVVACFPILFHANPNSFGGLFVGWVCLHYQLFHPA